MAKKRAITDAAKAARKQLLLDAALAEFFERGFSAARMDDIAARAGLTKGTIYLYFSTKKELFESLIAAATRPDMEQVKRLASNSDSSVFDVIRSVGAFIPHVVRQSNMPRMLKVLVSESNEFPDVVNRHREAVMDHILNTLTDVFRGAQQRGEIAIDDPELTARLFISPVVMSSIWTVVFEPGAPEPLDVERLIQQHVEIFIRGIRPHQVEDRDARARKCGENSGEAE